MIKSYLVFSAVCCYLTTTYAHNVTISNAGFDYIIIGGGTAGLTLAESLASDHSVSVAVVEAGKHIILNSTLVPILVNDFMGNPEIDWQFKSVPQVRATNAPVDMPRGKLLGGTALVNGMYYVRAHKKEYDVWEELGNPGWNFASVNRHMKAAETFYPASPSDAKMFAADDLISDHGSDGPIQVSFSTYWEPRPLIPAFVGSMASLGINVTRLASGGEPFGVAQAPTTIKPHNRSRSVFYEDIVLKNKKRPNLHIFTGAEVTKIDLRKDGSSGDVHATGIEYVANGSSQTLQVCPEGRVIVTAGTYQTPKILELSGIGNATLLKEHGITAQVDLPNVGENLQDHVGVLVSYELKPVLGQSIEDLTRNLTFFAEQQALYNLNRTGAFGSVPATLAMVSLDAIIEPQRLVELKSSLDSALLAFKGTPMEKQYAIQRAMLEDPTIPDIEIIFQPGIQDPRINPDPTKPHAMFAPIILHPFSRGNVHMNTSNPLDLPRIDLNFLEFFEFERGLFVEVIKYIDRITKTPPLSDLVSQKLLPLPNSTDAELGKYVQESMYSVWHPVGPTSMMPRDEGGIVDSNLKVYGTSNIHVADPSIIPLSLGTHTMASIYGVALRASEIFGGLRTHPTY
ncbi:unnamed protein product [Somion occarium]|uniref:Glucose-methanol-choline oxidoreductase N-terminal domain-containing protein n=1 Tax=Somion occarium TaxID=3059160 RepID=A0ABP1DPV9_9APHY